MEFLDCVVQDYAWGDTHSIPHLLGVKPTGKPQAELWMGAHPRGRSLLRSGDPLDRRIAAAPEETLGAEVAQRFGQLPFLFKVLAAGEPLSIQSHPTLEQAREGFEREDRQGIALDAPHRVYRDPNHKPELIAALTPFHAKCGFRPLADARRLFSLLTSMLDSAGAEASDTELTALTHLTETLFDSGEPRDVYQKVMAYLLSAPDAIETAIARATVTAAAALLDSEVSTMEPFRSELEWTARIADCFPDDIGVTVALLLNHVVLEPGEAVFLAAGNLHAYLSGVGMELMANSDNVVRGGLTPKHRDVGELLEVVDCSPLEVPIQKPSTDTWSYVTLVPEFALDRIVDPNDEFEVTGPEILFVQNGEALVGDLTAGAGSVIWIPASEQRYRAQGSATLWRARVPEEKSIPAGKGSEL